MLSKNHIAVIALIGSSMAIRREPLLAKNASPLLVHQNGDSAHPINYFVPDFGTDYEIAASLRNTGEQETRLKHKINF